MSEWCEDCRALKALVEAQASVIETQNATIASQSKSLDAAIINTRTALAVAKIHEDACNEAIAIANMAQDHAALAIKLARGT